jgi:glutamate synthase (NADPH/NADH) large chain
MLPQRLNREMVELESLDEDDLGWLRDRVEKHRHETGSDVAARILADWGTTAGEFVKIMPSDYRRVLEAAAAARESGTDEVEAIMAASRG